jgi:hypothetical protein
MQRKKVCELCRFAKHDSIAGRIKCGRGQSTFDSIVYDSFRDVVDGDYCDLFELERDNPVLLCSCSNCHWKIYDKCDLWMRTIGDPERRHFFDRGGKEYFEQHTDHCCPNYSIACKIIHKS